MSHVTYLTTNLTETETETLTIERGNGACVYDKQGSQYLEGMAGLWCTSLGYNNQELADATTEQMTKLSFPICLVAKPTKWTLIWRIS